jgi:hypothetical protein
MASCLKRRAQRRGGVRTPARLLAGCLAVGLLAAGPPGARAQEYTARRLPPGTTVTVDGDLAEFAGAPTLTVTSATTGATGVYRLVWDELGLYVAASVADAYVNALASARDGALWEDDGLELMFCTLDDRGSGELPGGDDYKLFVSATNVQRDERGQGIGTQWDPTWASAAAVTGTINANTDVDTGYRLELAITWAEWGIAPPAGGTRWGLEVILDDRYSTAQVADQSAWANANGGETNDPDGWGTLSFSECSAGPIPCPARDDCHDDGACDPAAGTCSFSPRADGSPCASGAGACQGGTCLLGDAGVGDGGAADGANGGRTVPLVGWRCNVAGGHPGAAHAAGALLLLLPWLGRRRRRR